jgi:hypothetical protein
LNCGGGGTIPIGPEGGIGGIGRFCGGMNGLGGGGSNVAGCGGSIAAIGPRFLSTFLKANCRKNSFVSRFHVVQNLPSDLSTSRLGTLGKRPCKATFQY